MSRMGKQKYSADPHVAEIYDQIETQMQDVELLLGRLIEPDRRLAVFEPFCGTGRITIPLARQGHHVVGLDESAGMLERLHGKLAAEPAEVRERVELVESPVFAFRWPTAMDLVLLGGNCFYEVSSSDEQRALLHRAAAALRPGGHVYVDNNDHQSAELSPRWRGPLNQPEGAFPSGTCADGTRLDGSTARTWFDVRCRLTHYQRRVVITRPDGTVTERQWEETCRPVIMAEVLDWLAEAGFSVDQTFGDRTGRPYGPTSGRCILWARRL